MNYVKAAKLMFAKYKVFYGYVLWSLDHTDCNFKIYILFNIAHQTFSIIFLTLPKDMFVAENIDNCMCMREFSPHLCVNPFPHADMLHIYAADKLWKHWLK